MPALNHFQKANIYCINWYHMFEYCTQLFLKLGVTVCRDATEKIKIEDGHD